MNTSTIEIAQNEVIREILNVNDMNILQKIKRMLRKECKQVAETSSVEEYSVPYLSKDEILSDFDLACKEMKDARNGVITGRPVNELLNEL